MSYYNEYRPGGFMGLPPITKNFILINVLLYFLTLFLNQYFGIDLYQYLALHYYKSPDFHPLQLITYIFMHGSFMHLFFNMFGLYIFGQVLEEYWGVRRFLFFYFITGMGAAVTHYSVIHFSMEKSVSEINELLIDPSLRTDERLFLMEQINNIYNSQIVVGASGSLYGLLAAFGMLFPNQLLLLYFFIPVKAKWLVIGYGLIELLSGLSSNPGDNIGHFAHVGGLVIGAILVYIWKKRDYHYY
jgi:membrane associated rhomboid family serine protease